MEDRKIKDKLRLLNYLSIDETTGCWNWTGLKHHSGYGIIQITVGKNKYKKVAVHRLAVELLLNIKILDKDVIHHSCHNRLCFNPDHLEITSQSINMLEKSHDWNDFYKENKEIVDQLKLLNNKVKHSYYSWRKKIG